VQLAAEDIYDHVADIYNQGSPLITPSIDLTDEQVAEIKATTSLANPFAKKKPKPKPKKKS
jgi:hypothetical protein